MVYLERIHGHEALRLPSCIGGSLPLNCADVGKALLAFSGAELMEEVLSRPLQLHSLTSHSITDPARLRMVLEKIQVSGLAYEEQEAAPGVSCLRGRGSVRRVRGSVEGSGRPGRGGPSAADRGPSSGVRRGFVSAGSCRWWCGARSSVRR